MSSWINLLQPIKQYEKRRGGVLIRAIGGQISCPCNVCYHRFWQDRDKVFNHLIVNGIQTDTQAMLLMQEESNKKRKTLKLCTKYHIWLSLCYAIFTMLERFILSFLKYFVKRKALSYGLFYAINTGRKQQETGKQCQPKNRHTLGPKSFARKVHQLVNEIHCELN